MSGLLTLCPPVTGSREGTAALRFWDQAQRLGLGMHSVALPPDSVFPGEFSIPETKLRG